MARLAHLPKPDGSDPGGCINCNMIPLDDREIDPLYCYPALCLECSDADMRFDACPDVPGVCCDCCENEH